jgi:hypothetical protein
MSYSIAVSHLAYERKMTGAHLVAIHSAKRVVDGTAANSAANNVAPPVGEEIISVARWNLSFHFKSVGGIDSGIQGESDIDGGNVFGQRQSRQSPNRISKLELIVDQGMDANNHNTQQMQCPPTNSNNMTRNSKATATNNNSYIRRVVEGETRLHTMFAMRETSEKASKGVICSWLNSELKVGGQLLCRGHPSMVGADGGGIREEGGDTRADFWDSSRGCFEGRRGWGKAQRRRNRRRPTMVTLRVVFTRAHGSNRVGKMAGR